MEHHSRNGIAIDSKKILKYVENVTEIYCITRLSLQLMFVKVIAWIELQREFATSVEARQLPRKVGLLLISAKYGIDTR
jgi:hypothetical protein